MVRLQSYSAGIQMKLCLLRLIPVFHCFSDRNSRSAYPCITSVRAGGLEFVCDAKCPDSGAAQTRSG